MFIQSCVLFFFGYEVVRFVTALHVIIPHYLYLIIENIQRYSDVCVSHQKTLKKNMECVICFLLGNSPASEFYVPTFLNTLFHLHRQRNYPEESI